MIKSTVRYRLINPLNEQEYTVDVGPVKLIRPMRLKSANSSPSQYIREQNGLILADMLDQIYFENVNCFVIM